MRILVWQWGRFGAGPRIAVELAQGFGELPGVSALLSLSRHAEIMANLSPQACALPVTTYDGMPGYLLRLAMAPLTVRRLVRRLRAMRPDAAICAMPGPLDLIMQRALKRCAIPHLIVVHDAQAHPGDGYPLQMVLQRLLVRRCDAVITFSRYIAERLRERRVRQPIIVERLPPLGFATELSRPGRHPGPLRLLTFGRLLPYKGLDLLVEALRVLGPRPDIEVRVVGSGPDSRELAELEALPGVRVENRWVPEEEVPALIAWSDALVLPYREASQSGVAALAVAARRRVVATDVGGLAEQFDRGMAVICAPEGAAIAAGIEQLVALRADDTLVAPASGDSWAALARRLVAKLAPEVPAFGAVRDGGTRRPEPVDQAAI